MIYVCEAVWGGRRVGGTSRTEHATVEDAIATARRRSEGGRFDYRVTAVWVPGRRGEMDLRGMPEYAARMARLGVKLSREYAPRHN